MTLADGVSIMFTCGCGCNKHMGSLLDSTFYTSTLCCVMLLLGDLTLTPVALCAVTILTLKAIAYSEVMTLTLLLWSRQTQLLMSYGPSTPIR